MPRKKKSKPKDHHHIFPSSVGGGNDPDNLVLVDKRKHAIYHMLFCNKTPTEILDFLVSYFWRGRWEYVEQALVLHKEKKNNHEQTT